MTLAETRKARALRSLLNIVQQNTKKDMDNRTTNILRERQEVHKVIGEMFNRQPTAEEVDFVSSY